MNEVYLVKHFYDEDGGFGDAIRTEETVAVFSDRETAEAYIASFKYHEPTVYDKPYAELSFGEFSIEPVPVFGDGKFPTIDQENRFGYDFCAAQLSWYQKRTSNEP